MTSDSIWGNYNSKQKMMIENIMFSVFIHKLNGINKVMHLNKDKFR